MRIVGLFILFLALFNKTVLSQVVSPDSIINPSSLRQLVETIASDSFLGRFTGSLNATKAAHFIAAEFQTAGLHPVDGNEGYFMPFVGTRPSQLGLNVIAGLKGTTRPEEVVIFCAHYDHIGTRSTNPYPGAGGGYIGRKGDTVFNGANDNASGTAAVINLARYFAHTRINERTILFIAFAGEELGLVGSKAFASLVYPQDIKAVINIEMIGRTRSRKQRKPFITGDHLSNFQKLLNTRLFEADAQRYGKKFFENDNYATDNLFRRSDNYWFALKGIPSHTIIATSPRDQYYHTVGDEPSTLDFQLMSDIVKAIAIGCVNLLKGIDTPGRINPNSVD